MLSGRWEQGRRRGGTLGFCIQSKGDSVTRGLVWRPLAAGRARGRWGVPPSAGCRWLMRGLILAVRTAPEVLGMAPPRPSPGSWGTLHLSGTGAPPSPRPHSHPSSHSVPSASTVSWDAELPTQQETGPETRGLVHTLSASWGQKQNWRPGRPDSNPTEQRGAQSCSRSRRRGLWTPPFFPTVQP